MFIQDGSNLYYSNNVLQCGLLTDIQEL